MDDREKVIKGLEACSIGSYCGNDCPYGDEEGNCICTLAHDALELLKAQEPVKPYMDFDGHDVWRCGNCGAAIFHLDHTQADEDAQNYAKFCRHCGKAVKWE
jgi:hypothetical protein